MVRLGLLLVAVGACGFDVRTDARVADANDAPDDDDVMLFVDVDGDTIHDPVDNCPSEANADQRDFDVDSVGDACDFCPHVAGSNQDNDGDDVGDVCDPRPSHPTEQQVIWRGFYSDPSEIAGWFNYAGEWTVNAGLIQANDTAAVAQLNSPDAYGDVVFATRLEVTATLGINNEMGMCAADTGASGNQFYCCGINGNGVRVASRWSNGPVQETTDPWTGTLAVGDTLDIVGRLQPGGMICTYTQGLTSMTRQTFRGPPATGNIAPYNLRAGMKVHFLFVATLGAP
ncbi:MAG: thrombospondin type 3 repeat-containing protein [Kofleriaceae bacterium]